MLYTFSQANYSTFELETCLKALTANDIIILWQDGILLPIHQAALWQQLDKPCYALQQDVIARGLESFFQQHYPQISLINLQKLVEITENSFPQMAY